MVKAVDEIHGHCPNLTVIAAPELSEWLKDDFAEPILYSKSWEEGKDDPWVYFHTSGTTGTYVTVVIRCQIIQLTFWGPGNPKPIKYTHRMLAVADFAASIDGLSETHIHHYAQRRWYTPMPLLHV